MRAAAPSGPLSCAALTFDDGPDPLWTPRVLDALDGVGARATFFVVPPLAVEHAGVFREVLAAGHEVGLHGVRHVRHTHRTRDEVEADAREGLEMLQALGVEPRLWRTPWGVEASFTRALARELGLRIVHWTADTHDWRGDRANQMLEAVSPALAPGAVVLMHDALGPGARRPGCEETVALVGPLAARLRSLGVEPVPVGELSGADGGAKTAVGL